MTNHPNRAKRKRKGKESPSKEQVRQLRLSVRMEQGDIAKLIHCAEITWQQWELGLRSMHPAFFELAEIKVNEILKKRLRVEKAQTFDESFD